MTEDKSIIVTGSGGDGGKGGGGGGIKEDPESLRSRSEASFVCVLSEGEIEGFEDGVDPLKRIYLDGVPVKNRDGSLNFPITAFYTGSPSDADGKGGLIPEISSSIPGLIRNNATGQVRSVVLDYRVGTQSQSPMPGFDDVRVEQSVGVVLKQSSGAVTRVTSSELLSKLRVRIGVGSLFRIDSGNGNVLAHSVQFRITIKTLAGSTVRDEVKTISGKSRGPVDFEYEYNLDGTTGPWVISATRESPDAVSTGTSDDLYFKAIVGIFSRSFRYPNTAIFGIKIGAESFTSIPQIAIDMLGVKVKVPSNYNPFTREYQGMWDGSFTTKWTNNPAWIFYDLVTNPRYGCGEFISESQIDEYSLYSIAQYCDELVPDGKGGREPRLTFNAYITDQGEAYEVLNSLASSFRGMLYFLEGTIFAVQDKPKQITKIFSPANVIQEVDEQGNITSPPFTYEGTARKARKTVALVTWNDPDDFYKAKVEYVEDREGIERYGYHTVEIRAFGTTTQGQAQRIGRWNLLSNQLETEIVTFKVSTEGFFLLPGEVIGIADPDKGGKRYGGRVVSATSNSITIDAPFTILGGSTYQLFVDCAGTIVGKSVTNQAGAATVLTLDSAFASIPETGAPWILQENNEGIRQYRIMSVTEDSGIVTVLAALYDPSKFTLADESTSIGLTRTSIAGPEIVPTISGGSIVLEVPS